MIKWLERQEKITAFERLFEAAREMEREIELEKAQMELRFWSNTLADENSKNLIERERKRIIIAQQPTSQCLSFILSANGCSKLETSLTLFLTHIF